MAINEPNMPDNVINIDPDKREPIEKTPAPGQLPLEPGGEVPATSITAGEPVAPVKEGGDVSRGTLTAPAAPVNIGKTEKAAEPDKSDSPPAPDKKSPKSDKSDKPGKQKQAAGIGGAGGSVKNTPAKTEPEIPPAPPQSREAPRPNGQDQIVYLNISELHPFKNHPFGVRDDAEMKALVESVRAGGVNQPALVRPIEDGGYEIIAGHRRQKASEMAGHLDMPCIPYLFIFWVCLKLGTAYRITAGASFGAKLIGMMTMIGPTFETIVPGLVLSDWLIGIVGAVIIRLVIYYKVKNARKFRRDVELS